MGKISLISVIVPVYNGKDVIAGCIESLLDMDYPKDRYEIIIVDNNSVDETAAIIRKYSVKYLFEAQKGPSAARNAGAKAASGDILAFTDADVIVDRNWLIEIEKAFNLNQDIAGVVGKRSGINKNFWAECSQKSDEIHEANMEKQGNDLKEADTRNFSIRRDVFEKLKGFNTSIINAEDFELALRLYHQGHRLKFVRSVDIRHINPIDPFNIVNARREQSFNSYKFAMGYDEEHRKKYFPTLSNLHYRILFCMNKTFERPILLSLIVLMPVAIKISIFLVSLLKLLGFKNIASYIFIFSLRIPTFHGKILGRSVERGYLSQEACYKAKIFKR